jgi:D-glycero-alpha-D-manno-heptose-7-phosphate kinase
MIITQTPLRVSFAGGGTDFPDYYGLEGGCVVSSAIDKYIYVVIKQRFDDKIRVGYTRTEMVDSVDEVRHDLVRECLRRTGITKGVEITTMADIPSEGSGLGSSSSLTVGLLNAMYVYQGDPKTCATLAEEACEIEIDILGRPIGKQDQYIAAFGNLRLIQFRPSGEVAVETIDMDWDLKKRLSASLLLFYTGITRNASVILEKQQRDIIKNRVVLDAMRDQAYEVRQILGTTNLDAVGQAMREGWSRKKGLADNVSNNGIDHLYDAAMEAGATGGKVAGAGGGGFLFLYCKPERQRSLREKMTELGLQELAFSLERDGTKIMLNTRR